MTAKKYLPAFGAILVSAIVVSLAAREPIRPPVAAQTGALTRFRLSATPVEKAGRYDDHDTPAFVVRGDGRLVAVWSGRGYDNRMLSRVSLRPGDAAAWSEGRVHALQDDDGSSRRSRASTWAWRPSTRALRS